MEITSGVLKRPQKVVVYGPEGIGKSTFASHFPDPLFLDIEDSTSQLDVKRIQGINSWEMLLSLISQINREFQRKGIDMETYVEKKQDQIAKKQRIILELNERFSK